MVHLGEKKKGGETREGGRGPAGQARGGGAPAAASGTEFKDAGSIREITSVAPGPAWVVVRAGNAWFGMGGFGASAEYGNRGSLGRENGLVNRLGLVGIGIGTGTGTGTGRVVWRGTDREEWDAGQEAHGGG